MLITPPAQKEKYAEILHRIKKGILKDQFNSTIHKLDRTNTGDLQMILMKGSTDKAGVLQRTIEEIVKKGATRGL